MIVVDTSALMAIFLREPDAVRFGEAVFEAGVALIGAPTAFEFRMVATGICGRAAERDPAASPDVILRRSGIEIVPWTERHIAIAGDAFARFGKGQGHPAQLNFGDCISYALARSLDAPLLYKGGDFDLTDVRTALPRD